MNVRTSIGIMFLAVVFSVTACSDSNDKVSERQSLKDQPELIEVAASDRQWTGVAVANDGRVFVNYPRWSQEVPFSVGQVLDDGSVRPFPDTVWNHWEPGMNPESSFVCVQAVWVDRFGFLWILDPANPKFQGVVPGGPKLVKVDLGTNKIAQIIRFDSTVAPANSYLNDVRVSPDGYHAYISESGAGAIIVVDLATGSSRRLLGDHASTKSEGLTVTIAGKEWLRPDGSAPDVHCDGIALDSAGAYVYYQSLTAKTLYRIATAALHDSTLSAEELGRRVEVVAETEPVDGIMFGPGGNLYLSALESKAIKRLTPEGTIETVVADERIRWPDSFSYGPDGHVYFTTSQIHLMPEPGTPFGVWKFEVDGR